MLPAQFITLEGGEGCGKSTQIQLLSQALEDAGIAHITTREPGGTPLAESIRALLVKNSGEEEEISPETELLLFQAARMAHVQQVIQPALEAGKWVLCDRFLDSTRIYQGIGKQVGIAFINRLHALTLGNVQPDVTLLLDIAPEEGLKRAGKRAGDETRFEELGAVFHQRVRDGFLQLAQQEPERIAVIDAHQSAADVHAQIAARVLPENSG